VAKVERVVGVERVERVERVEKVFQLLFTPNINIEAISRILLTLTSVSTFGSYRTPQAIAQKNAKVKCQKLKYPIPVFLL
jgi:hypothetical protein